MPQYNIWKDATREGKPLLILALDTSSRAGSVAVVRDDVVLCELTGDPARTHGERLPGDLARALERAHLGVDAIDLLAVAAGPGSFTGLRVGIAAMQGLAFSRGLRIVPVSTLDALADQTFEHAAPSELVAPWIDAQRGQVFAALFERDLAGAVAGASSESPSDTLDRWQPIVGSRSVVFAGDGAARYRDTIAAALGPRARTLDPRPMAAAIARIAFGRIDRAVAPHAVVPLYVRRPDAVIARERKPAR